MTLPWDDKDDREKHGKPVTRRLIFTDGHGRALRRDTWDRDVWKPALAGAGVIPQRLWSGIPAGLRTALTHRA